MRINDDYVRASIKKEVYEKLGILAKYEGRNLSKMLDILIEIYPNSKKILRKIRK